MRAVKTILGLSPDDPRYENCQRWGKMIDIMLAASRDPLRRAIVTVLEYQDADIEEYAMLICKMIEKLPPEQVP